MKQGSVIDLYLFHIKNLKSLSCSNLHSKSQWYEKRGYVLFCYMIGLHYRAQEISYFPDMGFKASLERVP